MNGSIAFPAEIPEPYLALITDALEQFIKMIAAIKQFWWLLFRRHSV